MAESFAFNIAEQVVGKLASLALQEVALASGVKDDLDDLKNTISTIQAVILDAEEQQSRNHQLTDWLRKLKIALYEAEDVLDEFEYEALRRKVANRRKQVRNFFSRSNPLALRFEMGHKLKKIREKMDKIAADKSKFNLTERSVDMHLVPRRREMTHSYVHAPDIIGREEEKENIVSILMKSSDDENVSVVPIIGIGGLGKTALAKLVYNDERIVAHFDKRMWVCVSDEFEIEKLTKKILTSATDGSLGELSIDQLQTRLRSELNEGRFLLVLDDVWNSDREKWLKLKELLMGGGRGSKILVTTRKNSVAEIMGTYPTQKIEGLSDEDSETLFLKCAFQDGQGKQYPTLVEIGKEIVKKCGGVPLAVRSLGGMLFSKVDERDWVSVRDNEIWVLEKMGDGILPALRLSYDELPSYLKQCFAFCSLFPKDYEFNSVYLIQFWLARGLIQQSTPNQDLEDIGNQYITELFSRSFFQDFEDHKAFVNFKMHDLVHDLGLSIAKVESNQFEDVCLIDSVKEDPEEVSRGLQKARNIRIILFPYEEGRTTGESFVATCTSRFKYIRLLDLSNSEFEVLPSSIGNLKHLRCLYLHGNKKIKKLPSCLCNLYHLQTLDLRQCSQLETLPSDIGNLISLRVLLITTKQRVLLGNENGLGCFNSLRCLMIDECENLEYLLGGMQSLTALKTLGIVSCPRLISLNMKHLPSLENLMIVDCERLNLMNGIEDEEDNFQGASSRLCLLAVHNIPTLEALPRWLIEGPAASTLHNLLINDCCNFKALGESVRNLTSIQELEISDCSQLSCLPEGMHHLTALKVLKIQGCPVLSERCKPERGEDWHKIAHVPHIYLDDQAIQSTTNT